MTTEIKTAASVTPTVPTVAPKAAKATKPRKAAKAKATPKAPKLVLAKSRRKSKEDGPVAFVHDYLDEHPKLRRSEAIAALEEEGIAYYTARTQFQVWFADRKAAKAKRGKGKAAKAKSATPAATVAA
jgi:hypothetical protein